MSKIKLLLKPKTLFFIFAVCVCDGNFNLPHIFQPNYSTAVQMSELWYNRLKDVYIRCLLELEFKIAHPSLMKTFISITKSQKSAHKNVNFRFKVNFLCQKLSESFYFFFIEEYQFRGTFFENCNLLSTLFSTIVPIICQLISEFW